MQWSTPRDLAWLATYALQKEEIAERMKRRGQRIWSLEGNPISISHTHMLLHRSGPVVAGKTGTTSAAGQCLLSVVQDGDREYVVILLNSLQRYQDMDLVLQNLTPVPAVVAEASN